MSEKTQKDVKKERIIINKPLYNIQMERVKGQKLWKGVPSLDFI